MLQTGRISMTGVKKLMTGVIAMGSVLAMGTVHAIRNVPVMPTARAKTFVHVIQNVPAMPIVHVKRFVIVIIIACVMITAAIELRGGIWDYIMDLEVLF